MFVCSATGDTHEEGAVTPGESKLVAGPEVDKDTWHGVRRQGIGGSDVAAVTGLSRYKSPYGLWLEKRGLVPEEEPSEPAYWGTVLEPIVAAEFELRTGHKVFPTPGTLQHPEFDWMLVNPDRLVCDEGEGCIGGPCTGCALLECKTTSAYKADDWKDDRLPYAAALQVAHAFAVTGYSRAYVPALIGGQRFVVVPVERDQELIDALIAIEAEFWQRVVENNPPEIDGETFTARLLARIYDVNPGAVVDLPDIASEFIVKRDEAKALQKQAELEANKFANEIRVLLGDAEIGMLDGEVLCTWKTNKKGVRSLRFTGKGSE
jgi:putative phage-type endonuclease